MLTASIMKKGDEVLMSIDIWKHIGKGALALATMTLTSIMQDKTKDMFVPMVKDLIKH